MRMRIFTEKLDLLIYFQLLTFLRNVWKNELLLKLKVISWEIIVLEKRKTGEIKISWGLVSLNMNILAFKLQFLESCLIAINTRAFTQWFYSSSMYFRILWLSYFFSCSYQWHPTPVLLPGKSHGQRSLVGCSPWGHWESDTTERLHFHFSLSCIGGGTGNPLQCSCLENPRDRGSWLVAVYGVAESDTIEAT